MSSHNTEIVFVLNRKRLLGVLTRIFTGCYCYHIGIKKGDYFYDMSWMRRRVKFDPSRFPNDKFYIFDSPVEISDEYLVDKILNDNNHYSFKDYFSFAFKGLFRFLKIPRKNSHGLICSEQVNNDLINNGFKSPFSKQDLPSPCELLQYFIANYPVKRVITNKQEENK